MSGVADLDYELAEILFTAQAGEAHARLQEFAERWERVAEVRNQVGKPMSTRNVEILGWIIEDLDRVRAILTGG